MTDICMLEGGKRCFVSISLHLYHHTNTKSKQNNAVYLGFHKLRSRTSQAIATSFCNSSIIINKREWSVFFALLSLLQLLKRKLRSVISKQSETGQSREADKKKPQNKKSHPQPKGKTQHIPCFEAHQRSELCLDPGFLPSHPYPCFLKSPSKATTQLCHSTGSLPY